MNQPDPVQSPEEFFAERIARVKAQPGGMSRALDAAWAHNADALPVAGDEFPESP